MRLFKRTSKLKHAYDVKLVELIRRQRKQFEAYEKIRGMAVDDQPEWQAHYKLQKATYYYLFKEARVRKIKENS
ncbi:Protein of unknown function [Alkalibacterium subtropicum]|uniref:Uncharacterized protein n=2 Tax=Alkalibacterium subtropicum TaxID=753702 RepID=A0A1I1IHJ9_9LACT|nr:Protein of unknown function [Alkalibacterium subtropicum]